MHIFVDPVEHATQTNTGDPLKGDPPVTTSSPADDQEMHSGNSSRRVDLSLVWQMLIALQVPPRPAPLHLITMATATPPALIDSRLINDLRSLRARLFLFAVRSSRDAGPGFRSTTGHDWRYSTPSPVHDQLSPHNILSSVLWTRCVLNGPGRPSIVAPDDGHTSFLIGGFTVGLVSFVGSWVYLNWCCWGEVVQVVCFMDSVLVQGCTVLHKCRVEIV